MHVVLCNCSPDQARDLARAVVRERLAACVNVLPAVTSYFTWDGELQEEIEHTLLAKVAAVNVERLVARLRELHEYETPEILVLPVDAERSDREYVQWVRSVQ